jgi:hypothetical protein
VEDYARAQGLCMTGANPVHRWSSAIWNPWAKHGGAETSAGSRIPGGCARKLLATLGSTPVPVPSPRTVDVRAKYRAGRFRVDCSDNFPHQHVEPTLIATGLLARNAHRWASGPPW